MTFVIKNGDNYFDCRTQIGPKFGATKEAAHRFECRDDAAREMFSHSFAFINSEIEEVTLKT